MNEIYNHKTISFCWPFGPRDSGPVGKPIIPHLGRYQGFAIVHYSVSLDALYLGHPRLSLNWGSTVRKTFEMFEYQKEAILISFLNKIVRYKKLAEYIVHSIKYGPSSPKESLHTIVCRIKGVKGHS